MICFQISIFAESYTPNGKRVIVIDDICTTCRTANAFIAKLQRAGANIQMALFLGKTISFYHC
ncbi:MAG: phosphoribosyltransferase [Bacteroidaceae bacterium]|nr:phosphoribosyltransferase [Bacteroidaceae bacterium]